MDINLKDIIVGTPFSGTAGSNFAFPFFVALGIRLLFLTVALGSFIFLLIGCVQWIMAGGDKDGIEKARKKITGALAGLAIAFSIYALAILIATITGVDILQNLAIPNISAL